MTRESARGVQTDTRYVARTLYGSSYVFLYSTLNSPCAPIAATATPSGVFLLTAVSFTRYYSQVTTAVVCRGAITMVYLLTVSFVNPSRLESRTTRRVARRTLGFCLRRALEFLIFMGYASRSALALSINCRPELSHD